jgi:hypothetical protein
VVRWARLPEDTALVLTGDHGEYVSDSEKEAIVDHLITLLDDPWFRAQAQSIGELTETMRRGSVEEPMQSVEAEGHSIAHGRADISHGKNFGTAKKATAEKGAATEVIVELRTS